MRSLKLMLILLYLPHFVLSQTQIPAGPVSGTWSFEQSPYHIEGDIEVPLGETLTILPGTDIYFTGEYQFDIYGQLIAEGTESDSIYFHADSLAPVDAYPYYTGFWYGMAFHSTDVNEQASSIINYCDIRHGLGNWLEEVSDRAGAALAFYQSSVLIMNTNIEDNDVDRYGGGIYAFGGVLTLDHVSISNSRASWGGGLYLEEGEAFLTSVQILDNRSDGIHLINSTVDIQDSFISGNASYSRAAIYGENVELTIARSEIVGNTTIGIKVKDATVALTGSRIVENELYGAYFSQTVASLARCEVVDNAGIGLMFTSDENWQTTFTSEIQNTLVAQNSEVGIKFYANNNANITNCTIADNTYDSSWGGIINGNIDTHVNNSIVYNNGSNLDFQAGGRYTYSIVQGNYVGQDEATTNLDNYDPVFRDAANGDYHLQSTDCGSFFDSPGIDAGDPEINDYVLDCATAGLGTELSDIGAYGGANNRWDDSALPSCYYAGDASGIWDCEEIFIVGDVTIPFGDTLHIMDSVDQIRIQGPFRIRVEGVLIAIGPESDHVDAHGDYIKFQGDDWHGISFNNLNDTNPGESIIENCRFDYADKLEADVPNGGAILIYNSDNVTVRHSFFYSNRAELGGAMYIENANPTIEDCKFEINGRSLSTDLEIMTSAGGAMYVKNANPVMRKLEFVKNGANDGGAVFLDNASPVLRNILLVKNEALGFAGAIFVSNSSPHIINMTAADNLAPNGGGTLSLMHVASQPEITNSILFGNSKPEIYINQGTPHVSYSIIDSAMTQSYFGQGCLDEDPLFQATYGDVYNLPSTDCGYSTTSIAVDAGHPDSLDAVVVCEEGLGTQRADMGYYGGMYSQNIILGLGENETLRPMSYKLNQNYPNPFNPTTTLSYELPEQSDVSLIIYDMRGQEVKRLQNGRMAAGIYQVVWNGIDEGGHPVSTGVYFCRLRANHVSQTIKMVYLR